MLTKIVNFISLVLQGIISIFTYLNNSSENKKIKKLESDIEDAKDAINDKDDDKINKLIHKELI